MKIWPNSGFRRYELRLAQNFTVTAHANKSHVTSRQEKGLINLHQKFELDITKNARDIAQYLPESTMYASYHCIVCTADKMTS